MRKQKGDVKPAAVVKSETVLQVKPEGESPLLERRRLRKENRRYRGETRRLRSVVGRLQRQIAKAAGILEKL